MGKTALVLAPMIVGGAVFWFALWVGVQIGRGREAAARRGISPQWAGDVTRLLRRLLEQPTSDTLPDDFVVLPAQVRSLVQELLDASPGAGGERAQNPRSGW